MIAVVSNLIVSSDDPKIKQVFRLMESDLGIQTTLRMSNVMAVERLKYNDRGLGKPYSSS
jgi:metal-dependent HD superfamily phosphatase/phosphodiesterase